MNNSVAFSTFTVLCNHHLYVVPNISTTPSPLSYSLFISISLSLSPQFLPTVTLYFVSMHLPIPDISYEWNCLCDIFT